MPDAIEKIRKAGVGPVDMQQSVIGPGMGVFSRHAKVLEDDDSAMSVRTALALINRVWEEIESDLDAAFDAETQVALAWFATYGFDAKPSGELITLANAKNVPLGALFASGVFTDGRGKAGLTARERAAAGLDARDRQVAHGLGVRPAHRPRARRPRTAAARPRRGSSPRWGRRPAPPAPWPTASTRSARRRAGSRRRWSTTSWPRNGRSWRTGR